MSFKPKLTGDLSFTEEERKILKQTSEFFQTIPDMVEKKLKENDVNENNDYHVEIGESWYYADELVRFSNMISEFADRGGFTLYDGVPLDQSVDSKYLFKTTFTEDENAPLY